MTHSRRMVKLFALLSSLVISWNASAFETRDGLKATYKDGVIKIVYRNVTNGPAQIALATRSYPILDIERATWLSWEQIYPEKKALRLKKGLDTIRPGKVKAYKFPYKLDTSKRHRLLIHGFGGTEIKFK